jgi:hypothetical protein
MENGNRKHSDNCNRDQPPDNEGNCSPPAIRHAEQKDHGHYGNRARKRDRQPERGDLNDQRPHIT